MANWAKKDEALIERVDGLLSIAPVRRKNMFWNFSLVSRIERHDVRRSMG